MYSWLRHKTEALKDQVIAFACDLVRTPSPSPKEAEIGKLVETRMKELGYDKVFTDEFGNAIGIMFGRAAKPTLLLACHMDNADPGDDELWDRPPYSATIQHGHLHGAGASDCKGGLAAQVFAGAALRKGLLPFQGNLIVAATVAGVHEQSDGIRLLMKKTLPSVELKPTCAVLGEPTGLGLYWGSENSSSVWSIDPYHPVMEWARHALAIAGCEVRTGRWHMSRGVSAGKVLTQEFNVPTIGYGPGNEDISHVPNEYVEVRKIVRGMFGTAVVAHSVVGIPVYGGIRYALASVSAEERELSDATA